MPRLKPDQVGLLEWFVRECPIEDPRGGSDEAGEREVDGADVPAGIMELVSRPEPADAPADRQQGHGLWLLGR